MVLRALSTARVSRLQRVLDSYDRNEVWLRVTNVFRLEGQASQVTFEPVDAAGRVIPDRVGRKRRHTFQAAFPLTQLVPRQVVFLAREGVDVRLHILPTGHAPGSRATAPR